MIQDKESMRKLTREISSVIERNLRAEILHERKAMLEAELARVRAELGKLGQPRPAAARPPITRARKTAPAARTMPHTAPSDKRVKKNSARYLAIQTLKQVGRPMTIKELTRAISRKGWKTERKNPSKTVDAALRNNPQDFHRIAPSTFELAK